ncbi:hypothetical protein [Mesorhizobium sp. M00.F.Ca.ET.216.01.1.1]|uniref:hypothetical protein n=1 Tax=Mesorhizobium sp. M00.F.Ca.ET.216.01.1.1 TaxID=2500528 RepID=UPI000FDB9C4E|nr:hypothetical protein [Mesorhizobium sp. M00.F.Ca.ET.216.01.1.1]TGQ41345.1 hypothetical protein EN859_013480 [Mesorhizobium sp. M00.F.Ca.ET.216.01.1.1]
MKARAGGDIFLAASTVLSKYVTKTQTAIFFGSVQKASLFLEQPSKMENLQFAQGILRELRQRAEADGEKLLTYLIDMAYLEASDRIRASWVGDHEPESRRAKGWSRRRRRLEGSQRGAIPKSAKGP